VVESIVDMVLEAVSIFEYALAEIAVVFMARHQLYMALQRHLVMELQVANAAIVFQVGDAFVLCFRRALRLLRV
jgi:hypothetical protein